MTIESEITIEDVGTITLDAKASFMYQKILEIDNIILLDELKQCPIWCQIFYNRGWVNRDFIHNQYLKTIGVI
jgi:hypothetical protein